MGWREHWVHDVGLERQPVGSSGRHTAASHLWPEPLVVSRNAALPLPHSHNSTSGPCDLLERRSRSKPHETARHRHGTAAHAVHSLAHQVRDSRLNLSLVVLRVQALARNDPQLGETRALSVRDRLLGPRNGLLDVQAVEVDRAVRLLAVVVCNGVSTGAVSWWNMGMRGLLGTYLG